MSAVTLMLCAWGIEALFGWPKWLFNSIKHPVVWMGALIALLDRKYNKATYSHQVRYVAGMVSSLVLIGITLVIAIAISALLPNAWLGYAVEAVIASSLLASRSLYEHIHAVAQPLLQQDLDAARTAVSQIVGRDPTTLDEPAMARASLESLAENMSDGVVAPLFWGALFGLPGLAGYKAVNTLDSMIGHRNDRYSAFGGFAARLDDVANFVPARVSGLLIASASLGGRSFRVMTRDAAKHRSPNAGWPEAAMAGGLSMRLSGPRTYGSDVSEEPWLNEGARDPGPNDIVRGLRLYVASLSLLALILGCVSIGLHYGT